MKRNLITSALAVVVFTVLLGIAYPLVDHRDLAGRVRRRRPTATWTLTRRATSEGRPALLPAAAVADGLQRRTATFFSNRGPEPGERASTSTATSSRPTSSSTAVQPGPDERQVPADAVTTSGSGRRPAHLRGQRRASRRAASPRVRDLPLERVQQLVEDNTDGRFLGLLGEPGVNVTKLNLALDSMTATELTPATPAPRRRARSKSLFTPEILWPRDRALVQEARPARAGPQPGHVRGRGRRR